MKIKILSSKTFKECLSNIRRNAKNKWIKLNRMNTIIDRIKYLLWIKSYRRNKLGRINYKKIRRISKINWSKIIRYFMRRIKYLRNRFMSYRRIMKD